MTWVASLYPDSKEFESYMERTTAYLDATSDRVPFSDWYDTNTARQDGFQARSVVGGIFMRMLFK